MQPSTGQKASPGAVRATLSTLSACLAVASVFAVSETLVRYNLTAETIAAPQLAMAVFANVALLGLIAAVVALTGTMVLQGLGAIAPALRPVLAAKRGPLLLALVAALMTYLTEAMSLGADSPTGRATCAMAVGALSLGLARHGDPSRPPALSGSARVGVVAVWLCCGLMVSMAVARTGDHLDGWLAAAPGKAPRRATDRPNIVLVVLDTVRADRVGAYGDSPLTPHLDRLAESSIVYANAMSTAPWTLPMHASLFTGVYPTEHGVNWGNYRLGEDYPTLGERLQERGYDTFAISNNWLLSEANGFARGFDSYIEVSQDPFLSRWRLALQCGALRLATRWMGFSEDLADDAGSSWTNWLMGRRLAERTAWDRPFFAFINYFEAHDPYLPPERFVQRFLNTSEREAYRRLRQRPERLAAHACGVKNVLSEDQIALMSKLYDAEIAYQDEVMGALMAMLDEAGLLETTWVVVTSDHGELFGERGLVYHTAGAHYNLLRVPLFVRPPGGIDGRTVHAPVQPVDIFTTLVEAAGGFVDADQTRAYPLPATDDAPTGRDLCVAETYGAAVVSLATAWRMDPQLDLSHWLTWMTSVYADEYLLELEDDEPVGLYHVVDDPDMKHDLADEDPQRVDALLARYRAWRH